MRATDALLTQSMMGLTYAVGLYMSRLKPVFVPQCQNPPANLVAGKSRINTLRHLDFWPVHWRLSAWPLDDLRAPFPAARSFKDKATHRDAVTAIIFKAGELFPRVEGYTQ